MPEILNFNVDKLKAKASILYISSCLEDRSMHRIFKILYFAEQQHLVEYGQPITGDRFAAMQLGPVPSFIYDEVKAARSGNFNNSTDSIRNSIVVEGNNILALEDPDMDEFSASDLECLNYSITENKDTSFTSRTIKSHDSAWEKAFNSNTTHKKMDFDEIAKSAGADSQTLDFIKTSSFNQNIKLF